jgi:hypothetical protein
MTALDTLQQLAAGKRPVSGLLHTARLEAMGVEAYGEEAIVESFRRAPMLISDPAKVVIAPGNLAIFDKHQALFADCYGDNISRVWRLGKGDPIESERGVSVVFDVDLAQMRGDVFVAASDHPTLTPDALTAVISAGQALARDDDPSDDRGSAYRSRAFVVRAFGTAAEGAALFAVYRLGGIPTAARWSGFAMAAAHWTNDEVEIVRDIAGEAALARRLWTPRIEEIT